MTTGRRFIKNKGCNIRVAPVYLLVIFPPLFLVFMEDKKVASMFLLQKYQKFRRK